MHGIAHMDHRAHLALKTLCSATSNESRLFSSLKVIINYFAENALEYACICKPTGH